MIKITTDFETQSEANLKKVGAYEYSMHPTTRAMCLAFYTSDTKKVIFLNYYDLEKRFKVLPEWFQDKFISWLFDPNVVLSAHNAFFEQCIYNNVLVKRFGWPSIPIQKWRCTAVKAAACALPRNLGDAGAVMGLRVQKDYEGHRVMLKLCKPTAAWTKWKKAKDQVAAGKTIRKRNFEITLKPEPLKFHTPRTAPEDFKILYKYCVIDAKTEDELDHSLPDLTPTEQQLWFIDQRINLRGVQVDMELVNRISEIMAAEAKTMTKELDVLTMGLVSSGNARDAILDFLTLEGVELPNLRAKTVDDFLNNGKVSGDAEKLLKIRRALSKSSTAKYLMFQQRGASDGRVRDILLYHAASTGRWGGKGIQPQNFPRGVIKDIYEAIDRIKTCSVDDLKMLYGENLMPLFSSVLRGMFIATPGFEMFVEDYNAIECRVLWWLAGHEAGLQKFRDGRDPYKIRAADIYKKSVMEVTDDERQVGKAAELGCGYQMGHKKFVSSAWDVYRAKVTSDLAKVAVTSFRKDNYPVVEMWEQYQNACIAAVENPKSRFRVRNVKFYMEGKFLKIELPSGRKLSYFDPRVNMEAVFVYEQNGETFYTSDKSLFESAVEDGATAKKPFSAKKFSYMAINRMAKKVDCVIPQWKREKSYGGKIVENCVQAVSRDILAEAIVRAWKAGFYVLMHSHDELVSEAPKNKFEEQHYKNIMEQLPAWAEGLPLKSGGWKGDRYRKG